MKRTFIALLCMQGFLIGQQPQPTTAQIAVINFISMMQSMVAIAANPDDKENVALQISNLFQGMGNIALAGMRNYPTLRNINNPEAFKQHFIDELNNADTTEELIKYCKEHHDELLKSLQCIRHQNFEPHNPRT